MPKNVMTPIVPASIAPRESAAIGSSPARSVSAYACENSTMHAAIIRSRLRLFSRPCARSWRRYAIGSMSDTRGPKDTPASERPLLDDQIAYYRARAPEYDAWWLRTGRFDRGTANNAAWHADAAQVEQAAVDMLARARPSRVLELACGTGLMTRHLAPRVAHVTAVDAAPEVIAINRGRVAAANVDYVQADLFEFEPPQRYDLVFMGFWLSHVPHARFDAFWA